MNKKETRIALKETRNNIHDKNKKDHDIFLNLQKYLKKNVLIYYSTKSEIDTKEIIQYILNNNHEVYLPKCINSTLEFYPIKSINDVTKGKYNIMEPINNNKLENFDNTICIIPGLGFDKNKNRIGYGGGYYDHFLENYPGLKIGLTYEETLLNNIPTEKTDIKMDIIITNKKEY